MDHCQESALWSFFRGASGQVNAAADSRGAVKRRSPNCRRCVGPRDTVPGSLPVAVSGVSFNLESRQGFLHYGQNFGVQVPEYEISVSGGVGRGTLPV